MAENTNTAVMRLDPQALLAKAVEQNAGIETLERLVSLARDVRAFQAKEAWHNAMAEFHRRVPPIKKTKTAKIVGRASYSYSYAPLDEIMGTISPVMGELGLHVSWESPTIEATRVVVKCVISHELGHSQDSGPVTLPISSESMGANAAQRVGIALTYARRYSLLSIAGLAPEDDDDAEGLGDPPGTDPGPDLMPKTTINATPMGATEEERIPVETLEPEPPSPPPLPNNKIDRQQLFRKLQDYAKKKGQKEYVILKEWTGKPNMSDLDDSQCRELSKKLDG
jgi:hypothetical protein